MVYLITAIEATGHVTANSMISGLPIEGDSYLKRVPGGVMADGFNSLLAGIFQPPPRTPSSHRITVSSNSEALPAAM
ncbi:MAG: solute carrier family 23 protein [Bacteroides thetaiotaomicron]